MMHLNPDHGVIYGLIFDAVLFGGVFVFFKLREVASRQRWEREHPRVSGGARRLLARMQRAAQPTLLFVPTKGEEFSKLGGLPDLPSDGAWPEQERSRSFVAQVDLGALRARGGPCWLPAAGRLYAFVDVAAYGAPDLVRIIFAEGAPGAAATPPSKARVFPERRVAFASYESIPSLDWLGAEDVNLTDEEMDELATAPDRPFGDELQHRIGGYPSEIQGGRMQVACELIRRGLPDDPYGADVTDTVLRASRQWRLLLQIDSDPGLKMNWGDGGRLYVFVREADARRGDFSRTITIFQTY